jgi:signal transduction histidine kinase
MRHPEPSPSPPPSDAEAMLALSHALRTPLTTLALGLGLLDDGVLGDLNEGQHEVVRTLVAEVDRLTRLVDKNLDIELLGAYVGPIERVRVDLGDLVRRAAAPIERQAEDRGVILRLSLPAGIAVVADPVKLGWVVVSLMGNALRYSPPGADIDVGIATAWSLAEISVTDRGPGLEPEVRDRIFHREGGPGLLLAREIVEAHGGSIAVTSAPGRGSTFTVSLPATDDESVHDGRSAGSADSAGSAPKPPERMR